MVEWLYGLRLIERPVFNYRSECRPSWLRCFATFLSYFQNMSCQCLKLLHDGFLSIFLHRSLGVLRCSQLCGLVFLSSVVWRCVTK